MFATDNLCLRDGDEVLGDFWGPRGIFEISRKFGFGGCFRGMCIATCNLCFRVEFGFSCGDFFW